MPLSVIVLWLSWLMWNPFSLFEYILSGKKKPKLKCSLPSFWQGTSDSKWLHGLFTDETSICPWTGYCLSQWLHFLYTSLQLLYSIALIICQIGLETVTVRSHQLYLYSHKAQITNLPHRNIVSASHIMKHLITANSASSLLVRFLLIQINSTPSALHDGW